MAKQWKRMHMMSDAPADEPTDPAPEEEAPASAPDEPRPWHGAANPLEALYQHFTAEIAKLRGG